MKLHALASLFVLVGAALGDSLDVSVTCLAGYWCQYSGRYFDNNGVGTDVNAKPDDPCPAITVPNMVEWCVDFGQHRGHFRYSWEASKRCLVETSQTTIPCGDFWYCYVLHFKESPCTWRRALAPGTFDPLQGTKPKLAGPTPGVKALLDKEFKDHGLNKTALEKVYFDGMAAEGVSTQVKRTIG